MRQFSLAFAEHIGSGATTLATCWRITRGDGVVLGFTDHDRPLSFEGMVFTPAHGLDAGEASSKLGAQTNTSEVIGILHAEAITEADIALGRYDGAVVEQFSVDWRNVEVRALLSTTTIGEIVREDGRFRAELRSGQHALNVVKGRVYGALCDAVLGDRRCGVDLDQAAFRAEASVAEIEGRHRLAVTGLEAFEPGWFGFGRVRWTSGARTGIIDGVVSHVRVGGSDVLGFEADIGAWVEAGDQLVVTAGCDRRFSTCREKFSNGVNFRGFPHVPGNDAVLRYPKAGDRLDGRALFR
jgi:uncharacterized phage protein (TIGR02218 family)